MASARGLADMGTDAQVTSNTPFLIGSISKSFTALAVMQLVEAGDVELDAEVSRYFDDFSGTAVGPVTIRQLLSHTSGFSTLQGNTDYTDGNEGTDVLARIVERIARSEQPAHRPGVYWEYSNVNYQVLGRLIEVVSGREYQAYIESNILIPIGMTHSFVADGGTHRTMARGHRPWFGRKRPLLQNKTSRSTAPQGGVIASAHDLGLYLEVMLSGEDDILSAGGKATMMRPANDASPFYGLGWFLDTQAGTVWHSGLSPGYETLATMHPGSGRAVVVLVNANSGVGFGENRDLLHGITTEALGHGADEQSSRWSQKLLFLGLTAAPLAFVLSMFWAWRTRVVLRAKSGAFGLFSLWFPLLTTGAAAMFIGGVVPRMFGVSLGTLYRFQPDFGLLLGATAVTGVLWAVFRLGVAYSGR